jgi:hypothetical protein
MACYDDSFTFTFFTYYKPKSFLTYKSQFHVHTYPNLGSSAIALGDSMSPAIRVRL